MRLRVARYVRFMADSPNGQAREPFNSLADFQRLQVGLSALRDPAHDLVRKGVGDSAEFLSARIASKFPPDLQGGARKFFRDHDALAVVDVAEDVKPGTDAPKPVQQFETADKAGPDRRTRRPVRR